MKKVVFRVDASIWIGTGHVMRCLVLADELKAIGFDVYFACTPMQGDLIEYIGQTRQHKIVTLSEPKEAVTPKSDSDYVGWLQKTVCADAIDFITLVESTDWIVVDHYALSEQWESQVSNALDCKILAIDDIERPHDADLILDQTVNRKATEYKSKYESLTGTNFALLAPKYAELHLLGKERKPPNGISKVLITMGGVDAPNATYKVLNALVGNIEADFTVLLSQRSPNYKAVKEFCDAYTNVEHIEFTNKMADLILRSDICIGAPGSTSWERACLGLPSVLVPLAENQINICKQLEELEIALKVSLEEIDTTLLSSVKSLLTNWPLYHTNSVAICDGKGVKRVVNKMLSI